MPYSAAAKKMMRDKYKKESPLKVAKEMYIEKPKKLMEQASMGIVKGVAKLGQKLDKNTLGRMR